MAFIETIFYSMNVAIGYHGLYVIDIGGAIFIHSFGAYFGLACSLMYNKKAALGHPANGASYNSNLVAMIGTLFLFIYWPSFNAALASLESSQA